MKLLRRMIRQIILEGPVKDSFDEAWHNSEVERSQFPDYDGDFGTMHPDQLRKAVANRHEDIDDDDIKELFQNKRDLKRLWNETIDDNNLRSFWEGPKMKYFHSLSYYGSPAFAKDTLAKGREVDDFRDLTAQGFFNIYKKEDNKDEMSTYGVWNGKHKIPEFQTNFGVIISGRVTLATRDDAFTESRSKASPLDAERNASSGAPKRIMPSDHAVATLLFEEEDIKDFGLGECVIDNWSVDAIVCNKLRVEENIYEAASKLAEEYNIPLLSPKELGSKM